MCSGDTLTCTTCHKKLVFYWEHCPGYGSDSPCHRIHGFKEFVRACVECRGRERRERYEDLERCARDAARGKAVAEYFRGDRQSPWTPEHLREYETQLTNQFYLRQRLHPFANTLQYFAEQRLRFVAVSAISDDPLARMLPARWDEAVRLQREIDTAGRLPTSEEVQQFHLLSIAEDAENLYVAASEAAEATNGYPDLQSSESFITCRNAYSMRRRLHPYPPGDVTIEVMRRSITDQAQEDPLFEGELPAQFEECLQRQQNIDATGRALTDEDQEFRLSTILGYEDDSQSEVDDDATLHDPQKRAEEQAQESDEGPEQQTVLEAPVTFHEWTRERKKTTAPNSQLSAESALNRDIENYCEYLRGYRHQYILSFLERVEALRVFEQRHWDFPTAQHGLFSVSLSSFRNWFNDRPEFHLDIERSTATQSLSRWLRALREYVRNLHGDDFWKFEQERVVLAKYNREYLNAVRISPGAEEEPEKEAEDKGLDKDQMKEGGDDREEEHLLSGPDGRPVSFGCWKLWTNLHQGSIANDTCKEVSLQSDITDYDLYLVHHPLGSVKLVRFRKLVSKMRRNDIEKFNHTPLKYDIVNADGNAPMSLQAWAAEHMASTSGHMEQQTSDWGHRLTLLKEYEDYLETRPHISRFRLARDLRAMDDRRELLGSARRATQHNLRRVAQRLRTVQKAIEVSINVDYWPTYNEALEILQPLSEFLEECLQARCVIHIDEIRRIDDGVEEARAKIREAESSRQTTPPSSPLGTPIQMRLQEPSALFSLSQLHDFHGARSFSRSSERSDDDIVDIDELTFGFQPNQDQQEAAEDTEYDSDESIIPDGNEGVMFQMQAWMDREREDDEAEHYMTYEMLERDRDDNFPPFYNLHPW